MCSSDVASRGSGSQAPNGNGPSGLAGTQAMTVRLLRRIVTVSPRSTVASSFENYAPVSWRSNCREASWAD